MLWRGVGSPLLGAAPINAIVFSVEGSSYRYLRTNYSEWGSIILHSLAGGIAGVSQVPISSVSEFIKIQLQTNYRIHIEPQRTAKFSSKLSSSFAWRRTPNSSIQLFYSILKYYSISTLTRGIGLTFIRDPLAYAIYFGVYDYLKVNISRRIYETNEQLIRKEQQQSSQRLPQLSSSSSSSSSTIPRDTTSPTNYANRNSGTTNTQPSSSTPLLPVTSLMVCGGIAGVASWLFLHPIDVLKSIQQGLPLHSSPEEHQIRTIFRTNYQLYGISFLFRGILATCIRAFPCSAVTFPIFEWMVHVLDPIVNHSQRKLPFSTSSSSLVLSDEPYLSSTTSSNNISDTNSSIIVSSSPVSSTNMDDLEMESVAGGSI